MKITLCTHKFKPPFMGGVDVYTDRLRRALIRLGHELTILAFDSSGTMEEGIALATDEYDGTLVRRVSFPFAGRPKMAFDQAYDPEMGEIVKTLLQELRPDIFVAVNFYTISLAAVEAAKGLGIPVAHVATDFVPICRRGTFIRWDGRSCEVGESIQSCAACFVSHRAVGRVGAALLDKLPEETAVRWANRSLSGNGMHPLRVFQPYWRHVRVMEERLRVLRPLRHQIDLVLAPTQKTRDIFIANGFKPEQVRLQPFGVDLDNPLAQLEHTPSDHVRFMFIGRLQPYKGADILVNAFNQLPNPCGATLTVYGAADDNYAAYFQRLQADMDANPRLTFAGTIPPWDLHKAFAQADYFVLPSTWHENSPLILLDALQSQTPVIASDIGGVTDVVKDGANGYLFPMGDEQALRGLLQRIIDQPDMSASLKPDAYLTPIDEYAQTLVEQTLRQVKANELEKHA